MKTVERERQARARSWAERQVIESETMISSWNPERALSQIRDLKKRADKPKQISVRQFDGGASSELLADFTGRQSSPNADIYQGWARMHFRAKEMAQNNPFANRFLKTMANNVIGPHGIKLQMDVKDPDGKKDERANEWIEKAWMTFSDRYFTTDGRTTRQLFENTAMKCLARDGELIVRLIPGWRGNPHRFTVMMMDPAQLDYEYQVNLPNGNYVRMGVEFDPWRRPVAYHFREHHYGEWFPRPGTDRLQRQRIPADQIIHAFVPDFPDQWRGYTWFHAAMIQLRHLNAFQEAAIVAARVGASKMGFFTQDVGEGDEYQGDDKDTDGNLIGEVEAGQFEKLPPGVKVDQIDWQYPNQDAGSFIKAMLKGAAAGLCMSYPTLAADLEGVNYSSIRAGVLEDRDHYKLLHHFFINAVSRPIFEAWLSSILLTDELRLPASRFEKFNAPRFAGRKWQWVDPLKDIQAEIAAIEAGLKSKSASVAETGEDFKQVAEQIAKDKELEAALGIERKEKPDGKMEQEETEEEED